MFECLNYYIDKVAHSLGGFFICVTIAVLSALVIPYWAAVTLGFITAVAAGIWKEWRDKSTGLGTPDRVDCWCTIGGAVGGLLVLIIVWFSLVLRHA